MITTTISVPAPKLRLMLTAVLAHTDEECDLPQISGVRFEYRDGTLYLIGTDRYTLGVAREAMPEAAAAGIPDQAATLPLAGAWELRSILKKRDDKAVIRLGDGKITVTVGDMAGSWTAVAPGNAAQGHPTFPGWREIIHDAVTGTQAPMGEQAAVAADKLKRLTRATDPRACDSLNVRLLVPAKDKIPMIVATVGDWFIGAVMLVRLGDENAVATNWADWAEETAPAEKPAPEAGAESAPALEAASA